MRVSSGGLSLSIRIISSAAQEATPVTSRVPTGNCLREPMRADRSGAHGLELSADEAANVAKFEAQSCCLASSHGAVARERLRTFGSKKSPE